MRLLLGAFSVFLVSSAFATTKPVFSIKNPIPLLGEYSAPSSTYCPGGFVACEEATIKVYEDGKPYIVFGDEYSDYVADKLWDRNGIIVFSVKDIEDDCDNPSCGNMQQITGVIYPKLVDGKYVPTIKATYRIEFSVPVEEDDYVGVEEHTSRLYKN